MNGIKLIEKKLKDWIKYISTFPIGEIYLNSMDNDGTGHGYEFNILNYLPLNLNLPIIMAGGAGNYKHLSEGLKNQKISAVATANLFNFVGDGLINARSKLISLGHDLAIWNN